MANQITQRLIAAGASPQKAQAFAQQYVAKTAKAGIKPKDIQDAFDAEIAAFAAAAYPNTYKPPAINDPTIRDYIVGAYGENVLGSIRDKSFSFKAPDLYKILIANPDLENTPDNKLGLDAYIVKQLYIKNMPIGELKDIQGHFEYDAHEALYENVEGNFPKVNQRATFSLGKNIKIVNGLVTG